ncbi:hypothetical protein V1517DRAFT_329359 [Lipomyces orientalis]|uniref:Uncharacterized protein n=1 Tax=Lipomyces orientalis TaxID=1233043 RepID=A0ACC3TGY6_9ASCO
MSNRPTNAAPRRPLQAPDAFMLQCPDEILSMILSYFTINDLVTARAVCARLSGVSTLNRHWKHQILNLWRTRSSMAFIWKGNLIDDLAFDLLPTGWFRAHVAVCKVVKVPWFRKKNDLIGYKWHSYVRRVGSNDLSSASGRGSRNKDDENRDQWTATWTFLDDGTALPLQGLSFYSSQWSVDNECTSVWVSANPPLMSGREWMSWKRMLFTWSTYFLATEPLFFRSIVKVHETIMQEIYTDEELEGLPQYFIPGERLAKHEEEAQADFDKSLAAA